MSGRFNLMRFLSAGTEPREVRILGAGLVLSGVCTAFFTLDILGDLYFDGKFPSDRVHLAIELGVVGLSLAVFAFHARELKRFFRHHRRVADQVRVASGQFAEVIKGLFDEWQLTPAERDVAILLVKGLAFSDIAAARSSREGTVKAQSNAIYRKAGVTGRHELLAMFLDELLQGVAID